MTREEAKELVTHSTMEANEVYNIIDQIFNEHEAELKTEETKIAHLVTDRAMLSSKNVKLEEQVKREKRKSRSIVAMLFWMMKRDQRIYRRANRHTKAQAELYYFCSKDSFTHAYRMLNDNA